MARFRRTFRAVTLTVSLKILLKTLTDVLQMEDSILLRIRPILQ